MSMDPDCHQFLLPQYEDQLMRQLMMAGGGDPAGGGAGTTKGGGGDSRKRRFTDEQVRSLESTFHARRAKLEPREKAELARELGLQPRQVAIWFQNKRARWRSKQLEHDYADLRARYDALRDRVEALRQEKLALAAQVHDLKSRLECQDRRTGSTTCDDASEVDGKRVMNSPNNNDGSVVVSFSRDDDTAAMAPPAAAAVAASSEDFTAAAGYYDDDHVAYGAGGMPDPFCNPPELWDAWPLLEWNAVA